MSVLTEGIQAEMYTSVRGRDRFFYCSNLPQGQGFHADPLDQAFLQVPGVQQVLFYLQGPQCLIHPVCCYKEERL